MCSLRSSLLVGLWRGRWGDCGVLHKPCMLLIYGADHRLVSLSWNTLYWYFRLLLLSGKTYVNFLRLHILCVNVCVCMHASNGQAVKLTERNKFAFEYICEYCQNFTKLPNVVATVYYHATACYHGRFVHQN